MKFRFFAILLAVLLTASIASAQPCAPCPEDAECALPECPTEEPTVETPQIRLWNRSEHDMENVTINFSDGDEDYADIPAGQASDYHAVDLAYSYAYIRLMIDGEAFIMQPIDYVGETPLEPGYFTYALDVVDDMLSLELLQVVATLEYQGGMCVYGACNAFITLYSNGTFVSAVGPDKPVIHTVDEDLVQLLIEAIETTDYEAIRSEPFTGTCPIAYDGQELIYTFYTGASAETLASCEYVLDDTQPLFIVFAEILATQPTEE